MPGDVPAGPELGDEDRDQHRAHDVGGVGEAEAEVFVEVVGEGLPHRRAEDLDHPEVEGDLGDLVEHPAAVARHRRAGHCGGCVHGADCEGPRLDSRESSAGGALGLDAHAAVQPRARQARQAAETSGAGDPWPDDAIPRPHRRRARPRSPSPRSPPSRRQSRSPGWSFRAPPPSPPARYRPRGAAIRRRPW